MEFLRLETLDQAKALVDCVYSVYGLTFHRGHIYEPSTFLMLNRKEHICSFVAMEGSRVVGHLAWIRPFYELERNGEPLSDPRVGEIGLSIVRPENRGSQIQTSLGLAMVRWAAAQGRVAAFMKCVTLHTHSQRAASENGAHPLAMFLGGIPKWVVYDDAPGERRDPLSTVLFFLPLRRMEPRAICLPRCVPWLADLVQQTPGIERVQAALAEPEVGATELEYQFEPAKHMAKVHVLHAGEDFIERIADLNRWLLKGHMEHVSYYLPADSQRVQQSAQELEPLGLFPGGWLPCLHPGGRDVLIYQSLARRELNLDSIRLHGDATEELKERVVEAWRCSLELSRPTPTISLSG